MNNYLNNRVLKLNVGFLLSDGAGNIQNSVLDIPTVRVSDDLTLAYVRGPLRLTRTQEGILVQADLHVGLQDECYRCLDPVARDVAFEVEELYGYHSYASSEFIIGDDAILDLSPLIRAEVLIDTSYRVLCREDCKGICAECGTNLNQEACGCREEAIDPRLAALKKLLESQ